MDGWMDGLIVEFDEYVDDGVDVWRVVKLKRAKLSE
jgi:hypothetical protein